MLFLLGQVMDDDEKHICVSCKEECGNHRCKVCQNFCHAIPPCCSASPDDEEEGYGKSVTCSKCEKSKSVNSSPLLLQSKKHGNATSYL